MPDEPLTDSEVRSTLGALVAEVDVDAAWREIEHRFRRDRRRRSLGVLATAAAVVVVLITAGIGVNARRSTDPSLDVADAPPMTEAALVDSAAQLEVTCDATTGTLATPAVAAGPAGVALAQMQGAGRAVLVPLQEQGGERGGIPIEGDDGPWVSDDVLPGSYDVRCGPARAPGSTNAEPVVDTISIGTLEVVDPNGFYTPYPTAGQRPSCVDERVETYESLDQSARQVVTWRLGPDVTFVGYRDQLDPVVLAEGVSGYTNVYFDGRSTASLIICTDDAYPLPAGDGLLPTDSLRTETDALAWLTAARDSGDANARIPKGPIPDPGTTVTITDQTAKLVRQDETTMDGQARSMAPGFGVWFVRVGYVGDDGVARVAVFAFSPAGDSRTILAYGDEPPPPGRDWSSWFDALPNHAA